MMSAPIDSEGKNEMELMALDRKGYKMSVELGGQQNRANKRDICSLLVFDGHQQHYGRKH